MFAAVVPPPEVVEDLDAFLEVRRGSGDLRWSRPEQLHVTLAFLPVVPDRKVEDLLDALAGVAERRRPMTMSIGGGGAFPDPAAARVLWVGVGVGADADELERLAAGCRTAATTHGVETPREQFRPHVTVARSGRPFEATRWLRVLDTYRSPAFTVDRFTLFASHLGEGPGRRPRHEVVAELEL